MTAATASAMPMATACSAGSRGMTRCAAMAEVARWRRTRLGSGVATHAPLRSPSARISSSEVNSASSWRPTSRSRADGDRHRRLVEGQRTGQGEVEARPPPRTCGMSRSGSAKTFTGGASRSGAASRLAGRRAEARGLQQGPGRGRDHSAFGNSDPQRHGPPSGSSAQAEWESLVRGPTDRGPRGWRRCPLQFAQPQQRVRKHLVALAAREPDLGLDPHRRGVEDLVRHRRHPDARRQRPAERQRVGLARAGRCRR